MSIIEETPSIAETAVAQEIEAGGADKGLFLFDEPIAEPNAAEAQPSPEEEGGQPEQSPDPAQQEEQRFEYWQSEADKKENENQQLREQLNQLNSVAPIARYIENNPQILDAIENDIRGGSTVIPNSGRSEELTMPERPVRPVGYDPGVAFEDPDSESGKYLNELDSYNENLANYNASLVKKQELYVQQQRQADAENKQVNKWVQELMTKHQYTYEAALGFIDKYTRPDSFNLQNLVALDRMATTPTPEETAGAQREAILKKQQETLGKPLPVAAVAGGTAPVEELTEEQQFNMGLLKKKRQ